MTATPFFYWLRRKVRPLTRALQFFLINSYYHDGKSQDLIYGTGCSFNNAIFNTASGKIYIGDSVIFGYSVMVLTGKHQFVEGRRISLNTNECSKQEVPLSGYDIQIGDGSWVSSGAILIGNAKVGKNSIVCAGAVVTKRFSDYSIIAGCPAVQIGSTLNL